jgi:hypothetical protein
VGHPGSSLILLNLIGTGATFSQLHILSNIIRLIKFDDGVGESVSKVMIQL